MLTGGTPSWSKQNKLGFIKIQAEKYMLPNGENQLRIDQPYEFSDCVKHLMSQIKPQNPKNMKNKILRN